MGARGGGEGRAVGEGEGRAMGEGRVVSPSPSAVMRRERRGGEEARGGGARCVAAKQTRARESGRGGEVCRAHPRQLTLTLTLTLTRCVGLTPAS